MLAALNYSPKDTQALLVSWGSGMHDAGRQMSHAMAHGYYGCRTHVIIYNEDTGEFGVIRK